VIEVDEQAGVDLSDGIADRIVATANQWAEACIASRSELGELSD
jgi:hypothetical protein